MSLWPSCSLIANLFLAIDGEAVARVKFVVIMATDNQAEAYRRLQELYADMSDSRIEEMAEQIDDLTETAQQVLRAEIGKRGLDAKAQEAPAKPFEAARGALREALSSSGGEGQARAEELGEGADAQNPIEDLDTSIRGPILQGLDPTAYDLVSIWHVDDGARAREVMSALESAGIESYLGADDVESVDDYKGTFDGGAPIKVMKFQSRIAVEGLRRLFPPDPKEESEEVDEFAVSCPKCNSPDVVFLGLVVEPGKKSGTEGKNSWTCDACGHQWEDDGIVEEV